MDVLLGGDLDVGRHCPEGGHVPPEPCAQVRPLHELQQPGDGVLGLGDKDDSVVGGADAISAGLQERYKVFQGGLLWKTGFHFARCSVVDVKLVLEHDHRKFRGDLGVILLVPGLDASN